MPFLIWLCLLLFSSPKRCHCTLRQWQEPITPPHPKSHKSIRFIISALKVALTQVEGEIAAYISNSVNERPELLSAVKGIGAVTAALLLAGAPKLGSQARRKISALIGVASVNRDSRRTG